MDVVLDTAIAFWVQQERFHIRIPLTLFGPLPVAYLDSFNPFPHKMVIVVNFDPFLQVYFAVWIDVDIAILLLRIALEILMKHNFEAHPRNIVVTGPAICAHCCQVAHKTILVGIHVFIGFCVASVRHCLIRCKNGVRPTIINIIVILGHVHGLRHVHIQRLHFVYPIGVDIVEVLEIGVHLVYRAAA